MATDEETILDVVIKDSGDDEAANEQQPRGSEKSSTLEYVTCACPVRSVVVFLDRAEVCRTVEAQIESKGGHEILLKSLPSTIDEESIRVEGLGAGVSITEVAFLKREEKSEPPSSPEDDAADRDEKEDEVEKQKASLKTLRGEKEAVTGQLLRIEKQRTALNEFADNIVVQAKGHHLKELVSQDSLDGIRRFYEMHEQQSAALDNEMLELAEKEKDLEEKIDIAEKELKKRQVTPRSDVKEIRELSILLHAEERGPVELHVSYVVSNAKWSPTYDIRVDSTNKEMQIVYFGIIEQSTGEDWKDAKLSLSTALPSVGGSAPELSTKHLKFYVPAATNALLASKSAKKSGFNLRGSFRRKKKTALVRRSVDSDSEEEIQIPQAAVIEGITSTTYEIEHKSTIPSDKKGHKVSVAVIPMKPEFKHETVPRIAAHAFLKASAKNKSQYAFLPGQANVFLDGNFVTKSYLNANSPGEDFECSLGADPAVKVTYTPFRKYHGHAGSIMTKSSLVTYTQSIKIHNGRPDECKIKVSDQLPRSTEEKIKVKLVEPEIQKADHGVQPNPRMNESNNIEWQLSIKKGDTRELTFKYSVESPLNKEVEERTVSPPKSR